jgi:leader peptidase (prepilin peptidase)/N-methyltransferase
MTLWLLLWTIGALGLGWLAERWWCQFIKEAAASKPRQSCALCHEKLTGWRVWLLFDVLKNRVQCLKCGKNYPWLAWGFPLGIWLGFWPSMPQDPWQLCQELLFLWSLLLISAIDWHTMWIDYRIITLTIAVHFTVLSLLDPGSLREATYGTVLGAGGLYLLGVLYESLRGRVGLGDGDPAVLGLIGAWTGPEALPFVIFVAAISGTFLGGWWLLKNRKNWRETPVPFAPFLCFGGLVAHWTYPEIFEHWPLQ